jgi:hypothetical protein
MITYLTHILSYRESLCYLQGRDPNDILS